MAEKEETTQEDKTKEKDTTSSDDAQEHAIENLLSRFRLAMQGTSEEEKEKPEQLLEEVTFEGVAKFMKTEKCKRVVLMTGAGVSTAAGIPDFRTPGTGLYDNLEKYNLPSPQSVFEIGYFKANPEPFYKLAKEIYPGSFKPTVTHYFIKLLEDKGLLSRIYTQNIDTLERRAGISGDKIVEAHGTFHTAHCIDCGKEYSEQFVKDEIFQDKIPKCTDQCNDGLIKPDIVFFGESLPSRFIQLVGSDMANCDLLIVIGTSLVVQPFASLINKVPETTPRLLINREKAGSAEGNLMSFFFGGGGFCFDKEDNYRDVAWLGDADDGCLALADLLGWKSELQSMVRKAHQTIDDANKATGSKISPKSPAPGGQMGKVVNNTTKKTLAAKTSPKSPVGQKENIGKGNTPKRADSKPKPKTPTSAKISASNSSSKTPVSSGQKSKASPKKASKSSLKSPSDSKSLTSGGQKDEVNLNLSRESHGECGTNTQQAIDDISNALSKTSLEDTSQAGDISKM